jgi:hypothetical protein
MNIYPFFDQSPTPAAALPLAREVARDPVTGHTVWRGGNPVIVTGADAVASWASAALRTERCRHSIYSAAFGCEVESLMGRAWSEAVKSVEAPRMVTDALTASPYITGVADLQVSFSGSRLQICGTLKTIYGEVHIDAVDL